MRPLKSFEYSTTVAANDWRKGKLRKAKRYNYYLFEPVPAPHEIFLDDFECGDLSAYTRGYLTGVTGYASITYHPNDLYATISHTNGVVVTQAADTNGLARPASITATQGATTHWTTGGYRYDGSANVAGIGDAKFAYDKVTIACRLRTRVEGC